jgi:TPR repeat protein
MTRFRTTPIIPARTGMTQRRSPYAVASDGSLHNELTAPANMAHGDQLRAAQAAMEAGRYGEAADMLEPLCVQGNPAAQSMLGVMYQLGLDVPADGNRAVSLLKAAAEGGEGLAAHNLSTLYATGAPGVERDPQLSRFYLRMARDLGVKLLPDSFYS